MAFYLESEFQPDRSVGYLIRRVHQLGQQALDPTYAIEGLTGTQWSTLAMIAAGAADTCATLARDIGHDKGAMTRVLDQLQDRGLVERERAHGDRRVVKVRLTAEGTAVMQRTKERLIRSWNGWLADWPDERVERLIGDLQDLRATLERSVEANACA